MKFELGKDSESAKSISCDIQSLLRTRMLVQANSGGGKSWMIRYLLEQTHGKVQQIIIDLEGEFSTLREKYDYVVVGKGGDVVAEVKTSGLLAERLLELNVSAIIDLFEIKKPDRILFVTQFLDSLINLPKKLWKPLLLIIDEAQYFCPEKKIEGIEACKDAVIDIMSRGRKRGFCGVLATQRISKLSKDAAAECNNKLIGLAVLDNDQKRASEELGFTSKQQMLSLRDIDPGEFFVFGPAIGRSVQKVKIGKVTTTHPEPGKKYKHLNPPPKEKIKAILERLSDLPKEAAEQKNQIDTLKSRVRDLEIELRQKPKLQEKIKEVSKTVYRMPTLEMLNAALKPNMKKVLDLVAQYHEEQSKLSKGLIKTLGKSVDAVFDHIKIELSKKNHALLPIENHIPAKEEIEENRLLAEAGIVEYGERLRRDEKLHGRKVIDLMPNEENIKLKSGARRMLAALVQWYPNGMTEGQMRSHAGLKKTGTYSSYKSDLKTQSLIEQRGDMLFATESGVKAIGSDTPPAPSTTQEVLNIWYPKLKSGARRMLDVLVSHGGDFISDEQLRDEAQLGKTGTYSSYKSDLKTARLITVKGKMIAADKETLFL